MFSSLFISICVFVYCILQVLAADMCYFEGGRSQDSTRNSSQKPKQLTFEAIIARDRLFWMGGLYSFADTGNITDGRHRSYCSVLLN